MTPAVRPLRAMFGVVFVALTVVTANTTHPTPANAASGDGITAYISPPFVQGPNSSLGATIEDFNSFLNNTNPCASSGFTRGVATFVGNCTITDGELTSPLEGQWGGANTSSATPTVGGTASMFVTPRTGGLTVTFSTPVRYFGLWWSAGGAGDTVKIYSPDNTLLATFDSTALNTLFVTDANTTAGDGINGSALPPTLASYPGDFFVTAIGGSEYRKGHYFGRPKDHTSTSPTVLPIRDANRNQYLHIYLNVFASGSVDIGKIEFPARQSFEFDNIAWSTTQQTPSSELVFFQSVLGKSVEFRANGGTGIMPAQSSALNASSTLSPNAFTRDGFTFAGWSTSPTGSIEFADTAEYAFTSDLILYAVWTESPSAPEPPEPIEETPEQDSGSTPGTTSVSTTTLSDTVQTNVVDSLPETGLSLVPTWFTAMSLLSVGWIVTRLRRKVTH